jgi:hypothetical protein
MNSKIGFTSKMAVVGSLALVGQVGQLAPEGQAQGATLTGVSSFLEVNTFTNSTYTATNPSPGSSSFPYILSREYFTNSGAYEILPFIRVKTSTFAMPAGHQVSGAQLGLFWTDSSYNSAAHSDFVDLWSVANAFTSSATMTTYDGANAWTDGFDAGVNGFTRTGPAGRHLAFLWDTDATVPAGTPSNHVINQLQEYKVFEGADFDAYLTQQIELGQDAFFELTNSNDSGFYQRFVATSDVNLGGVFANQPYLVINTAEVPEPTAGAILLVIGALTARRCRRRRAT